MGWIIQGGVQNGVYLHHESGAESSGAPQPGSGYSDDGGEQVLTPYVGLRTS
jgi:hypothetical protein